MPPLSSNALHQEQLPTARVSWSTRVAILLHLLLGRAPLRRLSQSLILILLLISPLSFSTDKITNFTYECPVSAGCSIKDNRCVGIQRRIAPPPTVGLPAAALHHALPVPLNPPATLFCIASPCRAPPA